MAIRTEFTPLMITFRGPANTVHSFRRDQIQAVVQTGKTLTVMLGCPSTTLEFEYLAVEDATTVANDLIQWVTPV